jgi:hypothetical protein
MKAIISLWKRSPKFRFAARTVGVAVASYGVTAWHTGITDYKSFVSGAVTAAITAAMGLAGLEPFVGVKPTNVEVPSPPAIPDPTPNG